MIKYLAKKCIWHLGIGILGHLAVTVFASRMHAGWFIGFLGACYLLAGWVCWMKSVPFWRMASRKNAPPCRPSVTRNLWMPLADAPP